MSCSDYEQINKNALVFMAVRESKSIQEKLQNVTQYLENGGDVNAQDGNDDGNTPLHMAVRNGEMALVRLLIDKGADRTIKNKNQKTPFDLAIAYNSQNTDVLQLLQIINNTSNHIAEHTNNNSEKKEGLVQLRNNIFKSSKKQKVTKKAAILNKDPKNEAPKFIKRKGTNEGEKGYEYERRLLSLILIRALNDEQIEDFLLGSNIEGIGALDDICLWWRIKNQRKSFRLFIQTKQRKKTDTKRLSVGKLQSNKGDFSLQKYFDSYIKIQDRKTQKTDDDPMFNEKLYDDNFVIYTSTSVNECIQSQDKQKTAINLNKKVHDLINTNLEKNPFQYKYRDCDLDILAKIITKEELNKLGKEFISFIFLPRNREMYNIMKSNHFINKYHVILGREVLQEQYIEGDYRVWKFCRDFLENECEYLKALKSSIFKQMSTQRCDFTQINDEDRSNVISFYKSKSAFNLSNLIGKLATYNDESKMIHITKDKEFKNIYKSPEYIELLDNNKIIKLEADIVREAVRIKLKATKVWLPLAFGNLDMTFSETMRNKIENVANSIHDLFKKNEKEKKENEDKNKKEAHKIIVHIDDIDITSIFSSNVKKNTKLYRKKEKEIIGGIGSAVGNLLVFDPNTNALKFAVEKDLPENAALFFKKIVEKFGNENLSRYSIIAKTFPIYSFDDNQSSKIQTRDYLNNLLFYADQATETGIKCSVLEYVEKYYSNKDEHNIPANYILMAVYDEMRDWLSKPGKNVDYFSRARDPFEHARNTLIDVFYSKGLQGMATRLTE